MLKSFRLLSALCIILSIMMGFGAATAQESGRQPITADNASMVTQVGVLEGHEGAANTVAFSPNGMLLASGGEDFAVQLWEIETGEQTLFEGHTNEVTAVGFNGDGTLLASTGFDYTVLIWDPTSGELVQTAGYSEQAVAFMGAVGITDAALRTIGWTDDGQVVSLGDAGLSSYGTSTTNYSAANPSFTDMAQASDGWFAVSSNQGITLIIEDEGFPISEEADTFLSVAINFDSTLLASGDSNNKVLLWDIADPSSAALIATLDDHTNAVSDVAFSPDGSLLVSSSLDGTLRLWNVETQEQLAVLTGTEGVEVRSVAFSPDGTLIASAGSDGVVRLWGVQKEIASEPVAGASVANVLIGDSGHPVTILDQEAATLILDAYIAPKAYAPGSEDIPETTAFPSGTSKLYIVIQFKYMPGAEYSWEVEGADGLIDDLGSNVVLTYGARVSISLAPPDGFSDGSYQATIFREGVAAIQLRWTVGGE